MMPTIEVAVTLPNTPLFEVGYELYWPQGQNGKMQGVWTVVENWPGSDFLVLSNDYGQKERWNKVELAETVERGWTAPYTNGAPRSVRAKLNWIDGNFGDFRNIAKVEIDDAVYFYCLTTFTRELVGVVTEQGRRVRKAATVQRVLELAKNERAGVMP